MTQGQEVRGNGRSLFHTFARPSIQDSTVDYKLAAIMAAIVETMTDSDEALDKREPESLEYRQGFTASLPAGLSYYWSTGTGTPLLDSLVQSHLDSQAAEWARQYPQRVALPDCASGEGEFSELAQEWEQLAIEGEHAWARIESVRESGQVTFKSCFTDSGNQPHGLEYSETLSESDLLAIDGKQLGSLIARVAQGPYLSTVVNRNSGGLWEGWLGTQDGTTAHYATFGHATEESARRALESAARCPLTFQVALESVS